MYKKLKRISLDDFVKMFEDEKASSRKYNWIKLINSSKLVCPVSRVKVSYCSYDQKESGSLHYNFYSEDELLFTIDHIIPLSKGGTNDIENICPMLAEYNFAKVDELTDIIKNRKEYITCAAIYYPEIDLSDVRSSISYPSNIQQGIVVTGHRHSNCINTMLVLRGIRSVERSNDPNEIVTGCSIQGFMTSNNRFVNRKEAAIIALAAKQIDVLNYSKTELYSEDLY